MMCDKISISSFIHEDTANGPGIRTTIFLQGCEIHCPGCQNRSTWNIEDGNWMTVDEIIDIVKKHTAKNPEKLVTISGGEPTLQYRPLNLLTTRLKRLGYEILLFTGHDEKWIGHKCIEDPLFAGLISNCDLVKAGPWVAAKHDYDILFRGSTNQRYFKVIVNDKNIEFKDVTAKIDAQEDWQDE